MSLSQKQSRLIRDLNLVLKRYSGKGYNPEVVVEVLSRAMRRLRSKRRSLKVVDVLPIQRASGAEILREQRKRLGLTMQKLAKKTGIVQPNLSAMENGKRAIGVSVARKLAKALQVNYRVLL